MSSQQAPERTQQPREQTVPCRKCSRPTWNLRFCDPCLAKDCES